MKVASGIITFLVVLVAGAGLASAQQEKVKSKAPTNAAAPACEMCAAVKQVADAVRCCDNCKDACPKCLEMSKKIVASVTCPACAAKKAAPGGGCADCKAKAANAKGGAADMCESCKVEHEALACPGCAAKTKAVAAAHCAGCAKATAGCAGCTDAQAKVAKAACADCVAMKKVASCGMCAGKMVASDAVRCPNCRFAEKPCANCQPIADRIAKTGCAACAAKKKG